jgi:hypothetical protein
MFGVAYSYGEPPNQQIRSMMDKMHGELVQHLADFNQLLKSDVAAYNKAAYAAGAATLATGDLITIKPVQM